MYQLVKISGANPETVTVLQAGDDQNALYEERDRLNAKSGNLFRERYAVRVPLEKAAQSKAVRPADAKAAGK